MECPHCKTELAVIKKASGQYWECRECKGRLVSVAVLRRLVDQEHVDWIWAYGREGIGEQKRPCPKCKRLMFEISSSPDPKAPKLDVCRYCTFIWFDPEEFDGLSFLPKLDGESKKLLREMNASIIAYGAPGTAAPREKVYRNPLMEAREQLAIAQIKQIADEGTKYPDQWWKMVPAILGIPVKLSTRRTKTIPWLTWSMTLTICAVSIYAF